MYPCSQLSGPVFEIYDDACGQEIWCGQVECRCEQEIDQTRPGLLRSLAGETLSF